MNWILERRELHSFDYCCDSFLIVYFISMEFRCHLKTIPVSLVTIKTSLVVMLYWTKIGSFFGIFRPFYAVGCSFSSADSFKWILGIICQNWIQRMLYSRYGCVRELMCMKCRYTKNRAMRLLKSSKHSHDNSKTPFNTAFSFDEWQLFLPFTLVTGRSL